jgi:alanine dehydrogenase
MTALVLGAQDLRPLVDTPSLMDSAIDAVERATVDFYQGKVRERNLVDQSEAPERPNLLQIHFAANDEALTGFQVFAESRGGPPAPNSRYITLLDPRTRQLLAIVDYTLLNPLRVGASAGLGCRYAAPENARVVGILGSSKQARAQLQAICRMVPGVERARIFSPTPEHREAFAREMSDWLDLPVEAVSTAEQATRDADVVGLANNSRAPVLDLAWVKAGALVISIGSGQVPADAMSGPRVLATTWDTLETREPYATAIKEGKYAQTDIAAELGPLITGEAAVRRAPSETVLFELTRLNTWALAVADWAYHWALDTGAGTPINLS